MLVDAHCTIASGIAAGRSVSPGAEWLVDNSHVIEEQIRQIRRTLPAGYYAGLPKLADGPFAGYPRIFGVSWAFIAHTDSRFDAALFERFLASYQKVAPLTIGELWAVSITLRIVLVENLRRAAQHILLARRQREKADSVATELLSQSAAGQDVLGERFSRLLDSEPLSLPFTVQLAQRLSDVGEDASHLLEALTRLLGETGLTPEAAVRDDHQRMRDATTTIRNIITSMRELPDVDWALFVEKVSCVDAEFRSYPLYDEMDFATRNAYRSVVERLARGCALQEFEIARAAVDLARSGSGHGSDPGYYLLRSGLEALKKAIGYQPKFRESLGEVTQRGGLRGYIASIAALTFAIIALPLLAVIGQGVSSILLVALVATGLLPAVALAIALVNHAVTHELKPQIVPALALREGIPKDARTLVVMPSLMTEVADVEDLLHRLETHHLATQQNNVFYALAADFTDAVSEVVEGDEAVLAAARHGIEDLNRRYPTENDESRFYLFARPRMWNGAEERWMGWERKRGKLHELNRLLRGALDTTYSAIEGDENVYPDRIRFVITLDADTRLTRETVRQLIGKMVHPVNLPVFSAERRRVVSGYGILQPRVTPTLPDRGEASVYQRAFSSAGGIDPYAGAASDVYQDMFGEGSYAGKGI